MRLILLLALVSTLVSCGMMDKVVAEDLFNGETLEGWSGLRSRPGGFLSGCFGLFMVVHRVIMKQCKETEINCQPSP